MSEFCEISPRVGNSQLEGTKPPSRFWKFGKSEGARVRLRFAPPTSRPSPTGRGRASTGQSWARFKGPIGARFTGAAVGGGRGRAGPQPPAGTAHPGCGVA